MEENKVKIRKFLSRFFKKHELGDDEDIFALGFVNSLFAMQLIMFLEKEFELAVDPQDMDFANFKTINLLASFVEKKTVKV
ncbi:phosphopantetheine binding protein [Paenibacillus cellulosilyticus]|uniref:Phosphopantetheine binding protein n=2 Tax=Paenibacillus cellulosilyticus TaxID=375489 RepID=A0A2V2Z2H5_9BACL|nr:phosphopantetheine binding protein [Paenibacillus cellulosilyticus]QKS46455.1 acyl carrier protein [Paenibacillus cellulosilyticus]